MKRIIILFLLLFFLIAITGCTQSITLHQPESEIIQIDLVYSPFGENEILHTITGEDISGFLDDLLELKLYKNSSPQNIGGGLIVQVVYSEGSVELLGTSSVGYISDGVMEHDGWYYLDGEDIGDLFSEYVDISQLPYLWPQ